MKGRRVRRGNKAAITNVRVVDEFAGPDGLKVDRMLSALQNSQSQCRLLCTTTFELTTTTSGADITGYYGGTQVRATDDFISFAAQFEEYRVTAIRFDVYDINPSTAVAHSFSTYHVRATGTYAAFPYGQVVDAPDSQVIPPGTGVAHFTWMAHTTDELAFQTTLPLDDSNLETPIDFGGLRWGIANASAAGRKWQVSAKAIVDFRGRS